MNSTEKFLLKNPILIQQVKLFAKTEDVNKYELLYRIAYIFKDVDENYDVLVNEYPEYSALINNFKSLFSKLFCTQKNQLISKEILQWKEVEEMDNRFVTIMDTWINLVNTNKFIKFNLN